MSTEFILRLIGMIVFSTAGVFWGISLGKVANADPTGNAFSVEQYAITIGLVGALAGLYLNSFYYHSPYPCAARAVCKSIRTNFIFQLSSG